MNAVRGIKGFSKVPIAQRMEQYTDKSGECWLWTASGNENGYGQIWDNGRLRAAHVVAYELNKGAVPFGYDVAHLCEIRGCVNPAHLEVMPHEENMQWRRKRMLKLLADNKKLVEALAELAEILDEPNEGETPLQRAGNKAAALLRELGED